jgi:DtxR family Mn-dependent transcriptional regulator
MPTIEKENYLKALYKFDERGEGVTVTALSRLFSVSKSTVSNMLKEMAKLGLVKTEAYKPIHLTDEGRQIAIEIVAKHRLIETFLVQVMGFEPDRVHQIAEELEHVRQPDFFKRMNEMLGDFSHDPHGTPIPNHDF